MINFLPPYESVRGNLGAPGPQRSEASWNEEKMRNFLWQSFLLVSLRFYGVRARFSLFQRLAVSKSYRSPVVPRF